MLTAPDGRSSRTTRFPPAASAPIARSLISHIPMPNIPGAAVGAINYEKPYVREKTDETGGRQGHLSGRAERPGLVRYSKQKRQTQDPAIFGIYGGLKPFAGTGTNPTQSVGGTYNRVWSATLVQEVRFGRTHHHNEAIGRGLPD